jgi:hypothetical protein
MPYTPPTVNYSATANGTYTTLTGVQSVVINRGKRYFQDPYTQSTCTIELIPATSYAVPLAIGQFIDVRIANSATSPCYFSGQITDVERVYAIPFNSGTNYAPEDRFIITATGGLGGLGSDQKVTYGVGAGIIAATLIALGGNSGVLVVGSNNNSTNASQLFTGSTLDLFNTLIRTGQYSCDDLDKRRNTDPGDFMAVRFTPLGQNAGLNIAYGDTGAGQRFKQIDYLSSVQNTFTQVQVEAPIGTATATTGSAPRNALVYNTLNSSLADVTSLANYLLGILSGQLTPVPFSIETDSTVSDNFASVALLPNLDNYSSAIGQNAEIVFRGSTVSATIQGLSVRFGVDRGSVQLYFSPSLGTPFTLDSSAFGVLDTNRLGYP